MAMVADKRSMDHSRFNLGQRVTYGFAGWVAVWVVVVSLLPVIVPAAIIAAAVAIGWKLSDQEFKDRVDLERGRSFLSTVWMLMKGYPRAVWTMCKQLIGVWQLREQPSIMLPDDFDAPLVAASQEEPLVVPESFMKPQAPDNSEPPMVSIPQPATPVPEQPAAAASSRADDPNPWAPPAPSPQGKRVGYRADGSSYVF